MQILMSEAAHARVRARLDALGAFDVVTLGADGALMRNGAAIESADPEVFWASLDLFQSGGLGAMFAHMLKSTNGKWAQIFAAGIDNPAFARIMDKGIRLTKSSAQAPAIADYVLCQALALLHPIEAFRAAQRVHEWTRRPFREIGSTHWALVGFGAIGREIAQRLQPFEPKVTVIRRNVAPEPLAYEVRATAELNAVAQTADVVVLACALNRETRGIAGKEFFAALKPGALLINIGRGGLVDEDALRAGLDRDQPAAAVLDVMETEPLPADSWMWDHPKLRLTPHTAGAGDGVLARGDALFLENLRRYRAGEALLNEADKSEAGG